MYRTTSAAVAATAILAVALTACGPGGRIAGKAHPTEVGTPTTTDDKPPSAAPTPKSGPARVGGTRTVHGVNEGSAVAVTLVKWVDPAKGSDAYTTPDKGMRFVAAQIRVANTGTAVYDDTPSNGMQVADTQGQRFEADYNDVSAGPSMPPEVKLSTGDKALGYVVFQVPKGSKIVTLQFIADSGFANEAAQWALRP